MKTSMFRLVPCVLALACAVGATAVSAQTTKRSGTMAERSSFIPYTQQGYIGLSAGQSKYSLDSGIGNYNFDDTGTAFKIYAGGYINPNFGVEFGYLNFGKVGTTYARTRTNGYSNLGVQTGKDNGFGLSYGLGARWAFNTQWAAVLEWERHRLHFADGKANTNMTTLGVQYRY